MTWDASMIETSRLILRRWRDEDLPEYATLNADPRVMEHFAKLLTRQESDESAARIRAHFDQHGFGFWAVGVRGGAPFVGVVGLAVPRFEAHFTPCDEIGWRLAHEHWNQGYATEAANATLDYGFTKLGLEEIVSFTTVGNDRSRRVMEKLGMTRAPEDDFDHPMLPQGHRLRRHVLYRLRRSEFDAVRTRSQGR